MFKTFQILNTTIMLLLITEFSLVYKYLIYGLNNFYNLFEEVFFSVFRRCHNKLQPGIHSSKILRIEIL